MHRPQCGFLQNMLQSLIASVGAHTVGDGNVNTVKSTTYIFVT
jgi:hypothetical protein